MHDLLTLAKVTKSHNLILKVQSHLLLSNELPCNREFHARTKEFADVTAP